MAFKKLAINKLKTITLGTTDKTDIK